MFDIIKFLQIFFLFVIIDFIWIYFYMADKYKTIVFDIQKSPLNIKIIPALLTYVAMTLLLILFPNLDNKTAFLLGLLSYAIYDLTNLTIFDKFDAKIGLYDIIWGGILFLSVNHISNSI